MLYFLISVKNVGANFSPAKGILCELAELVRGILPNQNTVVYFEFSRANRFIVSPDLGNIYPTESPLVEIYSPQGSVLNKGMVSPEIVELARAIVTTVNIFMTMSDPDLSTDTPVHTFISAALGVSFKYVDHTLVENF